ncbi:hypothetical protein E2C01_064704 [Portunus trituberculatus]|uniref:Uncharacterized protein n=1 Tax=Portunus trituberculatus TaxID=210409 RepID=A0A5B7HLJ4_PORTR|nr:hypothetical protein [Portunus trituberculatus]
MTDCWCRYTTTPPHIKQITPLPADPFDFNCVHLIDRFLAAPNALNVNRELSNTNTVNKHLTEKSFKF